MDGAGTATAGDPRDTAVELGDSTNGRLDAPCRLKRVPLTPGEADRLAAACRTRREKRVVWTLLDTGLLVSELARLTRGNVRRQGDCLTISLNGRSNGKGADPKTIPLSSNTQPLIEQYFGVHKSFDMSVRTIQRIKVAVAERAQIGQRISAEVLRYTFVATAVQKGISLPVLHGLLGCDHRLAADLGLIASAEEVIREFHAKW